MIKIFKNPFVPAILWLILVCSLLWIPGDKIPDVPTFNFMDKLAHVGLFAVLSFLWCRIILTKKSEKGKKMAIGLVILMFCLFFPIFAEFLQRYIPNRTFDNLDIVANLIGGIIGVIAFLIFQKQKRFLV